MCTSYFQFIKYEFNLLLFYKNHSLSETFTHISQSCQNKHINVYIIFKISSRPYRFILTTLGDMSESFGQKVVLIKKIVYNFLSYLNQIPQKLYTNMNFLIIYPSILCQIELFKLNLCSEEQYIRFHYLKHRREISLSSYQTSVQSIYIDRSLVCKLYK